MPCDRSLRVYFISDPKLETRYVSTTSKMFPTESIELVIIQFIHDEYCLQALESIVYLEVPGTLSGVSENLFEGQCPSAGVK